MLERGFAGFRFGRFRRLFIVGRITFIRRRSSMQGTCLAARRSILADLQRQTIDHDGCRSHTIRLDDANSRIFGVINIPQTICIYMIANQNIMFGIEDISNSAADFFFQHIVSLIRYADDATMNFDRCNNSYDNRDDFAIIGITSDAGIGIQFYAFGFFFERNCVPCCDTLPFEERRKALMLALELVCRKLRLQPRRHCSTLRRASKVP